MKKKFHVTHISSVLGCLLMLMAIGSADALVIDSFDTAQSLSLTADGTTSSTASGTGILGTERDLFIERLSGQAGQAYSSTIGSGSMSVSEESGDPAVQGRSLIQWDNSDGTAPSSFSPQSGLDPTGLGGVDLTAAGFDSFAVRVLFMDFFNDLEITVFTSATEASRGVISLNIPTDGIAPPPYEASILFTSFSQSTLPGIVSPADFSNVGAITMGISSVSAGADLTLDFLETRNNEPDPQPQPQPQPGPPIPEPSSLILLLMGGLGMLGYTWRRRKLSR